MSVRNLVVVFALLVATGCTTTDRRTASGAGSPIGKTTTVLVVHPDVQLGLLTANGTYLRTRATEES